MQLTTTQLAKLRNVGVGITMAISGAAALHLLTPQDATNLTNGVNQVSTGLGQVITGITAILAIVGPIVTWLGAQWAGRAATKAADPVTQATALVKNVPGTTIITSPALDAATPNIPAIVSNTEKKVVSQ